MLNLATNIAKNPVNYSLVDGQFFAPELVAESRPKLGESPVEFEILDELPA